ncbi:neisseria PilC beta-propeller domain protein [Acinetobacter sp. 983759]|uniref:pilus assembly protein n=1 Tax=Acinetobacter TaxID=469 RepID=UPI00044DF89D|nr:MULTISPECIES: PilC/PilY family type IV pilus protein [Acinetobacter]EXE14827.1 neisseria PilC beta-propeller domain protein [Acinetobacter sp. 983759]PKH36457.1 hypothetical protein BJF94_00225 [Acinetobacter radioresistens]
MKNFKVNKLCSLMTLISAAALPISTASYASDLTIYKGNVKGKTNILLMLDTSGSMGISSLVLPKNNKYGSPGDVDEALCERVSIPEYNSNRNSTYGFYEWAYNLKDPTTGKTAIRKEVTINNTTIPYYVRGCSKVINGQRIEQYDRLSRLKDAILPLLASNQLSNDVIMGLGHFSSKTELNIGTATNKLVDGHSGRILVGNAPLTSTQRVALAREIASFKSLDTSTNEDGSKNDNLKLSSNNYPNVTKSSSGTPTAHAYAEAGAYMMGTGTGTGGTNSGAVSIIYDGYMVMQNGSEQAYFICVEVGPDTTNTLGATVKQCINNWPAHDAGNQSVTTGTINNGVYKPNKDGGWSAIASQSAFKSEVGAMGNGWDTFKKLPEGWRYGGWMKVNHEPMDIEPIVGTVWTGYAGGTIGIVSYRTNPFSIRSGDITTTITTQGFQNCPSGFSVLNAWNSLCYQTGSWSRSATSAEIQSRACSSPAKGEAPLPNARNPNGSFNNNENYNKSGNTYPSGGGLSYNSSTKTCNQTSYVVNRPWGNVTQTITTTGPIDNNIGGFAYSASDTKNGSVYKRGGSTDTCDGNGIYFLTDGAPNSTKDEMAQTIMNITLSNNTFHFTGKPTGRDVLISPRLQSNLFSGETGGWEYIGEYAKKILDPTKNPGNMKIRTAVVGFGTSFAGVKQADNSYDCEVVKDTNPDAYNACKWGSNDYGAGGFYYAENTDDIKNSIIDFVEKTAVNFSSTSMGTISIPLDPLDQTKAMNTGFFPMIEPSESNNRRTWLGNLKKYYVINGTLSDKKTSGGNLLYKIINNQQVINENAKDIWSNQDGNNSLIYVGGVWNKIPVPGANNINNIGTVRHIYTMDGTSLKKVTKENLATDYTAPTGDGTVPQLQNISLLQRYALLNYLGYAKDLPTSATSTLAASDIAALPVPTVPYRYLGGVVHSTPLVVTKEATLKEDETVDKREEYVVYGSMDGGLHIVDADSGLEKSVFVPQEVLNQQPETLAGPNAAGRLAYGVDAPWTADNTFKITSSTSSGTTSTKYIARSMNIYGGLRMGGRAIYGLNIEDPSKPKLLFHKTPSSTGFERLGQIWSKPVITNIRVKGEVKKVLIFGGGYDETVFENDAEKTVVPNGPTAGNALYIVDAANGNLIWSVSSNNTGTGKTNKQQKQADVKFSVVGQPAVRDYNADGLTDVIYFADLGGQVFRVDLNNAAQASANADNNIAVRTQTLARLATASFTPRFYERPSTAVFKEGQKRFVLVTLGSGNRSYPLEKEPGLNQVYGLLDWDAAAKNLEKDSFTPATVIDSTNLVTTGILGKTQSQAITASEAIALKNGSKRGWSFALKTEAGSSNNGYVKAMEETQLIKDDLYVSVYDPQAALGNQTINSCGGGIQGLSTMHRICMPYGNCAAYATTDNQGIIGVPLGSVSSSDPRKTQIVSPSPITAEKCVGEGCGTVGTDGTIKPTVYSQSRAIRPIRWYEQ